MNELRSMRGTIRHGEHGGARANFLIVAALLAVIAYAGYNYVPVAYQAYQFKDVMQQDINKAAAMASPREELKKQLKGKGNDYGVPPDAEFEVAPVNGRLQATVKFTRPIQLLPGYTYKYEFDYTAKSSDLFTPK